MINRYPGNCYVCGVVVRAGAREMERVGEKWRAYHPSCRPASSPPSPAVNPGPVPEGWKPSRCADCGSPHPCLSKDGATGPWRCSPCHNAASPRPPEMPPEITRQPETPQVQGSLI